VCASKPASSAVEEGGTTRRGLLGAVATAVCGAYWTLPAVPSSARPVDASAGAAGVLNVVAHPDDDLLFLSPALLQSLRCGDPVQTLFLTAGDAGAGPRYWRRRELGVRAAYARMARVEDWWVPAPQEASPYVTVGLAAAPHVRLSFVRLPDGGHWRGDGYHPDESLLRLWRGQQARVAAVDRSGAYSRAHVVDLLLAAMAATRPAVVRTLDFTGTFGDGDHDDHHATAYLTQAAASSYAVPHRLESYLGYPVARRPANVTGALLEAKTEAFTAYASRDPRVCAPADPACGARAYPDWLRRQYRSVARPRDRAGDDGDSGRPPAGPRTTL
jgi:LmbE family N-acetylglucosaminyl deacetylase